MMICTSYIISIWINLQNQASINFNGTGLIMRADSLTGKTIWAKDIVFVINLNLFRILKTFLKDDSIWALSTLYSTSDHIGIITEINSNGDIIKSYSIVNDILNSKTILFIPDILYIDDDHSVLIFSETAYNDGELGISSNSQFDSTLLKLNTNFEIEWYTSMDYNNLVEHGSFIEIYSQSIYVSFNSDDQYLSICKLSSEDGSYQDSKIIKSFK